MICGQMDKGIRVIQYTKYKRNEGYTVGCFIPLHVNIIRSGFVRAADNVMREQKGMIRIKMFSFSFYTCHTRDG